MFISKRNNNSNIKKLSIIKSIRSDELNNECFDCGSYNPEFISINNAIFLCRNCALFHLNFDDNISRIINNNLYNLEEKELYYLYFGGNRKLFEFIYLNPKLNKYKADLLYKTKELRYYRYKLNNKVNEKLGINKNIESYKYEGNQITNSTNSPKQKRKYNRRRILCINETNDFKNYINNQQIMRYSTTNILDKKYKKRYIPEIDINIQNNRISMHNKSSDYFDKKNNPINIYYNPERMSSSDDLKNQKNFFANKYHSNNNSSSNFFWLNNSNNDKDKKINSYGYLGPNFSYKNYINNTININNSSNNNFYFNQSENELDKGYNIRNSSNNNYVSLYDRYRFEIPKKQKINKKVTNSLNLSVSKIYLKPKLPKYKINTMKIKKDLNSLNFGFFNNNNYNSENIYDSNKIKNKNINYMRQQFNLIKSKSKQGNNPKFYINKKEIESNFFSDDMSKKTPLYKSKIKDIITSKLNEDNDTESYPTNKADIEDEEKIQNLSIIDINNNIHNEIIEKEKRIKKYKERKNLEKKEREKMEYEEQRRKEELKIIKEEKKEKKKKQRKKMTKKEKIKLLEEERFKMQQEDIRAKKKKAFENKVIKEEDEEYEQEIETPRNKNKEVINKNINIGDKISDDLLNKDTLYNNTNTNINNNTNKEIVDTFKNSIRNKYKRRRNKL